MKRNTHTIWINTDISATRNGRDLLAGDNQPKADIIGVRCEGLESSDTSLSLGCRDVLKIDRDRVVV